MMDCLFCNIIAGRIPSAKVYEDEYVYGFKDISPIAPIHYLLIPKTHIASINEITPENADAAAKIFAAAAKLAKEEGIDSYRIISNCGEDAGQTVMHLHFHMLAGVKMGWGKQSLG